MGIPNREVMLPLSREIYLLKLLSFSIWRRSFPCPCPFSFDFILFVLTSTCKVLYFYRNSIPIKKKCIGKYYFSKKKKVTNIMKSGILELIVILVHKNVN